MQAIIRCFATAVACFAVPRLFLAGASMQGLISVHLQCVLSRLLAWTLRLLFAYSVNSLLNNWAENRWRLWDDAAARIHGNEVAVITGGSNGIGLMVVERLLALGMRVAILDVEAPCALFSNVGTGVVSHYPCDVSSPEDIRQAAAALRSDHGPPSILINNAGIGAANTILEISHQRLQTCIGVNLLSHWYTIQEFLPDMIAKRKGHIMSTSSLAAFASVAAAAEYSACKVGLLALHETLTQELKHRYKCPEIKTTIVFPNWTSTRLIGSIQQKIRARQGPLLEPSHVADVMVKQIVQGRSGQLIVGPKAASVLRALPIWMQELVRDQNAYIVTRSAPDAAEALAEPKPKRQGIPT